jgi:hypothetical protein
LTQGDLSVKYPSTPPSLRFDQGVRHYSEQASAIKSESVSGINRNSHLPFLYTFYQKSIDVSATLPSRVAGEVANQVGINLAESTNLRIGFHKRHWVGLNRIGLS